MRAPLVDLYHDESAQHSFFEDASDVREVHNYVRALDYGLERSKTLPISRLGEWENWLLFFLKGISSQSLDAITRIERLGQLRAAYRERLRSERAVGRLLQILDVLFERPILNIRQLEAALNVPYRTAQRYIERLEEIGILREVTGQARNRLYRADEIIEAL